MKALMTRLELEVNETKTRLARIPEDTITFLGYTLGQFYGKEGRPFIGTRPSRKAVKSLFKRIHDRTTKRWYADTRETQSPSSAAYCAAGAVLRSGAGHENLQLDPRIR